MYQKPSKIHGEMPPWVERTLKLLGQNRMSQAALARQLNIDPSTVSLYFSGEREIPMDRLKQIASILSTNVSYLMRGTNKNVNGKSRSHIESVQKKDIMLMRKLLPNLAPVLEWNEAKNWREIMQNVNIRKDEGRIFYPSLRPLAKNGHFHIVKNDAMTAPEGQKITFNVNDLIFVDPDVETYHDGNIILVCRKDKDEAEFFKLIKIEGFDYLKPLNPKYSIHPLTDDWEVIGLITSRVQSLVPESY